MKTLSRLFVLGWIVLGLFPSALAFGQEAEPCSGVYLLDGWARASAEAMPNSAVYGTLINLGAEAETLLGGATAAAEAVEVHEVVMGTGDVMQMQPVEGGLTVEPNNYTVLQPGGYHMMLIGLTMPLEAGTMLDITLSFANAGDVAISVPVRDAGTEMEIGGGMGDSMMATEEPMMEMHRETAPVEWSEACAGIHVLDPWVRPTMEGMPNTGGYGLFVNFTDAPIRLVGGSTGAAEVVEVHEMLMGAGDVMQMRPVEGGLTIEPGSGALLKPGGLHLMLIGVTAPLMVGSTIELTVLLADESEIPLTMPVRMPPEMAMGN